MINDDKKLPFWMYDTIIEALNEKANSWIKRYKDGVEEFEAFKNNPFHHLGRIHLSIKAIEEMREKHDQLIKDLLINSNKGDE